jgi:hypothetical protein
MHTGALNIFLHQTLWLAALFILNHCSYFYQSLHLSGIQEKFQKQFLMDLLHKHSPKDERKEKFSKNIFLSLLGRMFWKSDMIGIMNI